MSFWTRDDDNERPAYGPRFSANWLQTHIWDGGCPVHANGRHRGSRDVESFLRWVMAPCDCVCALHLNFDWCWGLKRWSGVIEWTAIARLHPKYQAPDPVGFYARRAAEAEKLLDRARTVLREVDDVLREGLPAWPKIPDRIEWTRWCIREHRRLAAGLPASENL